MTIGVWGYTTEYADERDDILDAVDQVFGSGRLILGESVAGFEREFAAYHELAHGVGVDNGTNALVLALRALGVAPGDEVITVANTAAPTIVAIDAVGAVPVFVDVDEHTYLMDVDAVETAVTSRTTCILPVHLYGQSVAMEPLLDIARRHGLRILEDCAQAHGARHGGRIVGTFGDAAAYSFYPTKVLGGYGDGGAVLSADDEVIQRVRRLRYYGMDDRYYVVEKPAYNSRLDEVQAEILRRKLVRLDGYLERRRKIADRYRTDLADTDLVLPTVSSDNEHVYYLYVVRHPQREAVMNGLAERGVRVNVSYAWPVNTMSAFSDLGYGPGSLPTTEYLADQIFSLPMYPSLTDDEQDRVISALRETLSEVSG